MANDDIDDLRARREEIQAGAARASARGSTGRIALMAGAASVIGAGAFWGITQLVPPTSVEPPIPTSETTEFPEDRTAQDTLELPAPPPQVVISTPAPAPEVDSATLARLRELQDELAAARERADELEEGSTARERELQAELEAERDRFAADIAALRSSAENDQDRSRETEAQLQASLRQVQADLQRIQTEAEADRVRRDAERQREMSELAARHAEEMADRQRQFMLQLEDARRVDPLEADHLRLEQQRLAEEEARRARLAAQQEEFLAQQEARIRSDLLAVSTGSAEEGSDGVDRALSAAERFVRRGAGAVAISRATQIASPEATVAQGTIIQASLETAIDSSLPGPLRAVVNEDVHSLDGSLVLIPGGSRLFGEYKSDIETGSSRILIVWTRILTPSNRSISIASFGADALGRSGTGGAVDTRFFERFGSAAAVSIITGGAAAAADSITDDGSDVAEDLADDIGSQSQSAIQTALSLGPRIYVRQGASVSVILDRDVEIF
ncbi:TrbI/VirB10 family protein [Jannaschia aquimarina]|uniref:Type IV secretion system protein virB10 n=1 Tax=Jannaschia aquimarina TaxID=935700 RepID=A0A0D1EFV2_9RHOB|nr:TrbI/VirB10 family protein [Jannaschia aquimarina]KIT16569.1 Type IV secretion system protein virB10 [Jannaschia aquimarina]SNT41710.1 type IV secretion system protein VirB10 [Jannaschia aquimarina]